MIQISTANYTHNCLFDNVPALDPIFNNWHFFLHFNNVVSEFELSGEHFVNLAFWDIGKRVWGFCLILVKADGAVKFLGVLFQFFLLRPLWNLPKANRHRLFGRHLLSSRQRLWQGRRREVSPDGAGRAEFSHQSSGWAGRSEFLKKGSGPS